MTVNFSNFSNEESSKPIDVTEIVIGQWATYLDTGMWTLKDGYLTGPEDLTIEQLKDFLRSTGGAVYLREDERFGWLATKA